MLPRQDMPNANFKVCIHDPHPFSPCTMYITPYITLNVHTSTNCSMTREWSRNTCGTLLGKRLMHVSSPSHIFLKHNYSWWEEASGSDNGYQNALSMIMIMIWKSEYVCNLGELDQCPWQTSFRAWTSLLLLITGCSRYDRGELASSGLIHNPPHPVCSATLARDQRETVTRIKWFMRAARSSLLEGMSIKYTRVKNA